MINRLTRKRPRLLGSWSWDLVQYICEIANIIFHGYKLWNNSLGITLIQVYFYLHHGSITLCQYDLTKIVDFFAHFHLHFHQFSGHWYIFNIIFFKKTAPAVLTTFRKAVSNHDCIITLAYQPLLILGQCGQHHNFWCSGSRLSISRHAIYYTDWNTKHLCDVEQFHKSYTNVAVSSKLYCTWAHVDYLYKRILLDFLIWNTPNIEFICVSIR